MVPVGGKAGKIALSLETNVNWVVYSLNIASQSDYYAMRFTEIAGKWRRTPFLSLGIWDFGGSSGAVILKKEGRRKEDAEKRKFSVPEIGNRHELMDNQIRKMA